MVAGWGHKALLAGGLIQTCTTVVHTYLSNNSHKALLAGGLIQTEIV